MKRIILYLSFFINSCRGIVRRMGSSEMDKRLLYYFFCSNLSCGNMESRYCITIW